MLSPVSCVQVLEGSDGAPGQRGNDGGTGPQGVLGCCMQAFATCRAQTELGMLQAIAGRGMVFSAALVINMCPPLSRMQLASVSDQPRHALPLHAFTGPKGNTGDKGDKGDRGNDGNNGAHGGRLRAIQQQPPQGVRTMLKCQAPVKRNSLRQICTALPLSS